MEALKKEAINVISKMPDTAEIDDIMYRLYVIDKVDAFVKSRISPPLVGGDKGEGDITS